MSTRLAAIKMAGTGTNPRIFTKSVIMAEMMSAFFYYMGAASAWSQAYQSASECFDAASIIEAAKRKDEEAKKKAKRSS